jgi:type II secretory pathway pseudopilin PulG
MVAVAVLTITMLGVSQNYRRSIVRDREVEMIHRGVQYERAVQRYYRKFGNYPPSMEALENTSNIRFLRKRYKDPMTRDGKWKIAHLADIKLPGFSGLGATGTTAGTGASAGNLLPGAGGLTAAGVTAGNLQNAASGANLSANNAITEANSGSAGGQTAAGTPPNGSANATGNGPADTTGPNGTGTVLGGGPMLGVISNSSAEGIHSFNDTSKYREWYFIYDPNQDKITNGSEPQLTGPYNPKLPSSLISTSTTAGGQTGAPAATTPNSTVPTAAPSPTTQTPTTTPNP